MNLTTKKLQKTYSLRLRRSSGSENETEIRNVSEQELFT